MPRTHHLLVFTRYPKPGTTKTRLIPALGASGAAALQRLMTEHTLRQADVLAQSTALSTSIHYVGSDRPDMARWLGKGRIYRPQGDGDLGDRLVRAFSSGLERAAGVIAIGIDCPALSPQRLQEAFDALDAHDVVLGPASDGGYYLIGLKRNVHPNWPALFSGIDWGSDRVFAQTEAQTQKLGLSHATLPVLTDVDYPNDLAHWQAITHQTPPAPTETISIIVPVLNEASRIQAALKLLQRQLEHSAGVEIIVVDGGSTDNTAEIARSSGIKLVVTASGRARQMNAGAAVALGDILLFLHSDTQLPDRFVTLIRQTLTGAHLAESSARVPIAGAFSLKIRGHQRGLRLIEQGVDWRSRWLNLPYGDQALFVRGDCFRQLGGFPDLPIMEDFELVRQLRQRGRLAVLPESVVTSGRRWQTLGVLQTTLINQLVIAGYFLGVPPKTLNRWYRRHLPRSPRAPIEFLRRTHPDSPPGSSPCQRSTPPAQHE